ncbi:hypothetical protein [Fibrobacter intestinalis]|uniref:Uncharacterized protein n=1 Tax=Fibrobacter intestinalis TaxID=28122 RepID=A0A1T4NJ64_9BACT|nr:MULTISPECIES: hypothetical protein [Fibrobacter]PBC72513.1 hypothetical protein BGW94_0084 [Fibrobacter sp. NR9]SJZ79096.1 hypothetical protein SAMN02745108_01611 [Fibrobacter intestinalis]
MAQVNRIPIAQFFQDFWQEGVDTYKELQDYYQSLPNIDTAIREACFFHNKKDKLEPHQYRIRKIAKQAFFENVSKIKKAILKCQDFKGLHDLLEKCKPKYLGPLAIYDAALRLGIFLQKQNPNCNFEPQEVYLHRGTEEGAKKLMKLRVLSFSKAKIRPVSDFSWLCPQRANDSKFALLVENFLCVKKSLFR